MLTALDPPLVNVDYVAGDDGYRVACGACDFWWWLDEGLPLDGQLHCPECDARKLERRADAARRRGLPGLS